MITIAMSAANKESEDNLVIAGDKGSFSFTSETFLPRKPFIQFGDFPVLFGYSGYGTGVISEFVLRLYELLIKISNSPDNFSTFSFKNNFSNLIEFDEEGILII